MRIRQTMVVYTEPDGYKYTIKLLLEMPNKQVKNMVYLNRFPSNDNIGEGYSLKSDHYKLLNADSITDEIMDEFISGDYDNLIDHKLKTITYSPYRRPNLVYLYAGGFTKWSLN
jgi:hypothetical protein